MDQTLPQSVDAEDTAARERPGPGSPLRRRWGLYLELGKARLSALVVMTTATGYWMAAGGRRIDWLHLLWTVVGTSLVAGAANAFNQVMEVRRDALMHRTRRRPMPSRRIGPMHATAVSILAAGFGLILLASRVNFLTAGLGLLSTFLYLVVYTPLKPRTALNTMVGSVVGAIPPLMGWAAAVDRLDPGAWVLGALLLVWQVPHFLSLAWLYRGDYERGGFRMLPQVDASGATTGYIVVLWSLALLPVTLAVALLGLSGGWYATGAGVGGVWMLTRSLILHRDRTDAAARKLFLASIIYLPLLLALMVADRRLAGDAWFPAERPGYSSPPVSP